MKTVEISIFSRTSSGTNSKLLKVDKIVPGKPSNCTSKTLAQFVFAGVLILIIILNVQVRSVYQELGSRTWALVKAHTAELSLALIDSHLITLALMRRVTASVLSRACMVLRTQSTNNATFFMSGTQAIISNAAVAFVNAGRDLHAIEVCNHFYGILK